MLGMQLGMGQFRPPHMPGFQPCLSYAHEEIDPALDPRRDEGEPRLRKVRALVRFATKTAGMEHFLKCDHKSSLASMLAPRAAWSSSGWHHALLEGVQDALLSLQALRKPAAALLQPSVKTLSVAEVDALDEFTTMACVPIKRSNLVALPGSPPVRLAKPRVLLTWPRELTKSFKGAVRSATLLIECVDRARVRMTVTSADATVYENLYACDVPTPLLDGVFAPIADSPAPSPASLAPLRVPACRGELPEMLALQIAGFAQIRLRAHVLTAVSGPDHTNRPLWFENMKVCFRERGKGHLGKPRALCVNAFLHPSSATCFCGAHLLGSPQQRFKGVTFTGVQQACMRIEMCGEQLPQERDRGCPTHGYECQRCDEFAPRTCCSNLKISFSCHHEAQKRTDQPFKPYGLELPVTLENTFEREELSMLLAMCAEYERRSAPLFGSDAPADAKQQLCTLVKKVTQKLDQLVERFDMHDLTDRTRTSDADLARLDLLAAMCLREGGMTQAKISGKTRTARLQRPAGPTLGADEKKLAKHYHWMFPRFGQPCGKRILVPESRLADLVALAQAPAQAPAQVPAAAPDASGDSSPEAKRARTQDPNYAYEGLYEYLDPDGFANLREQLRLLMAKPDLPPRQRERGLHFQQFLQVCDAEFGEVTGGPLGLPARPLYCKYRTRNDGGRLYPTGMPKAPGWQKGDARSVCIQGAPREVRPFLCCRWAHDFDMANAQPELLRQMPLRLTWTDGRSAPSQPELERWCADRPEYIQHVAEVHSLPTDAERHYEYRKDLVKELMISLMFGGLYESWIRKLCEELGRSVRRERRSPRVAALQDELARLRTAVFESQQWLNFVDTDRRRLKREGKKKDDDAIDRSVFARVAQRTENEVLTVMRQFCKEHGWTVLTLCFDGMMCEDRPGHELDLVAMQKQIRRDTGYDIKIVEKPLFSKTFPVLSLNRV